MVRKADLETRSRWEELVDDDLDYPRARGHPVEDRQGCIWLSTPKSTAAVLRGGRRRATDAADRPAPQSTVVATSQRYRKSVFVVRRSAPIEAERSQYMRAINSFLNWVRTEGETVRAKAPLPRLGRKVLDVVIRDELRVLEDGAATERDKLIMRLLADTGIRLGELLALRGSDFVERDRHAYLKIQGKGAHERLVPLSPTLAHRLHRHAERGRRGTSGERLSIALRRRAGEDYRPLTPSRACAPRLHRPLQQPQAAPLAESRTAAAIRVEAPRPVPANRPHRAPRPARLPHREYDLAA